MATDKKQKVTLINEKDFGKENLGDRLKLDTVSGKLKTKDKNVNQ
jgi:hypothetical protein